MKRYTIKLHGRIHTHERNVPAKNYAEAVKKVTEPTQIGNIDDFHKLTAWRETIKNFHIRRT